MYPTREPQTIGALAIEALHACFRHWRVFAVAAAVAIGAQAALYFSLRTDVSIELGGALFLPILDMLIYIVVANDFAGVSTSARSVVGRIAERAWAVIVIDAIGYAFVPSLYHISPESPMAATLAFLLIVAEFFFIFADVDATLRTNVSTLELIPRALASSFSIALRPQTVLRPLVLTLISMLLQETALAFADTLRAEHVHNAQFWAAIALTLAYVPLAALVALCYLDSLLRLKPPEE